MVLAQKETYGSMEQNREPRSKPTHLWSINIDKEGKNIKWEKRQPLQQVVLGKLNNCMQIKFEHTLTPYTKINSKWVKYLNMT